MSAIALAIVLSGIAGLAMPLGAWIASIRAEPAPLNHAVTAFGGGALFSAVALVLVPEAAETLPVWLSCGLLVTGGVSFFGIDRALQRSGGSGAQLMAMLLDYLPEAAALGAMLVIDRATAWVLAAMIFLQNLPEGYSAFREVQLGGKTAPRHALLLFLGLAMIGPLCAVLGLVYLAGERELLGAIMIFAAGGILYLVFEDVAPAARDAGDPRPPLGAVAGFALGLAGHLAAG